MLRLGVRPESYVEGYREGPGARGKPYNLHSRQISVKENRPWRKAEEERRPSLERRREPTRRPGPA